MRILFKTENGGPMSLNKAEAEFIRVAKEIRELEERLSNARKRAEKLAHYIEIARELESHRPDAGDIGPASITDNNQSTIIRLADGAAGNKTKR